MDISSSGTRETGAPLPLHPFFSSASNPPSFTDCLDAIHKAESVMELMRAIEFSEENGGLSNNAMNGYYLVSILAQNTLSYACARLQDLGQEMNKEQEQTEKLLSSLVSALESSDKSLTEKVLPTIATHMGVENYKLLCTFNGQ